MHFETFGILIWVIIVVFVWIYIRRNKPDLIGSGKNLNKQKLDRIKFNTCPNCKEGTLQPKFKWWQYSFILFTPFGILTIGKPSIYTCTNCEYIIEGNERGYFSRISLTHKLSKPFFIGMGFNIAIVVILAIVFELIII